MLSKTCIYPKKSVILHAILKYKHIIMGEQIEKQCDLRQRDGFTTFWLWLGIITNCIAFIVYTIMAIEVGKVYNAAETAGGIVSSTVTYLLISGIFGIFFSIAHIIGNYLMLKWKKKGFYVRLIVLALNIVLFFIIVAATNSVFAATDSSGIIGLINGVVSTFIVTAAMSYLMLVIFCSLIGIAILYAVLHLRKNDKSCWKLMD